MSEEHGAEAWRVSRENLHPASPEVPAQHPLLPEMMDHMTGMEHHWPGTQPELGVHLHGAPAGELVDCPGGSSARSRLASRDPAWPTLTACSSGKWHCPEFEVKLSNRSLCFLLQKEFIKHHCQHSRFLLTPYTSFQVLKSFLYHNSGVYQN